VLWKAIEVYRNKTKLEGPQIRRGKGGTCQWAL